MTQTVPGRDLCYPYHSDPTTREHHRDVLASIAHDLENPRAVLAVSQLLIVTQTINNYNSRLCRPSARIPDHQISADFERVAVFGDVEKMTLRENVSEQ
jgi:hypothetical protein